MDAVDAVRASLAEAKKPSSPAGAEIDGTELQAAFDAGKDKLSAAVVDVFKQLAPEDLTEDARTTLADLMSGDLAGAARRPLSLVPPVGRGDRADRFAAMRRILGIPAAAPKPAANMSSRPGYDAGRKPVVVLRQPAPTYESTETAAKRIELWDYRDAATAWITPNNAELNQQTHGYGTHNAR